MRSWRANAAPDEAMGSFILTEIRELRKGMEGRDSELRGEIAAVRDAVTTLSSSVARSQDNVNAIRDDLGSVKTKVSGLESEVRSLQETQTVTTVKNSSRWDGPKNILAAVGLVGGGAAALLSINKVWPVIVAMLI